MSDILDINGIKDGLNDYYEQGGGKTFYAGFNALSNHYNIKEGGVTDWSGYPGSGKTELLLQVLVNSTKWYGHKHLIYMPDAGSNEEVVAKLIHKFTGKQFEEFYYNKKGEKVQIKNRITQSEMLRVLPEIMESFKIFIPEVKKGNKTRSKAITPVEYWNFASENKKELGIFSGVIDSWNYMKHDVESQRHDQWLEEVLSYRNELAERNNLKRLAGSSYYHLNIIFYYLSDYESAKKCAKHALQIWQNLANKKQEAYSSNSLGLIYLQLERFIEAQSAFTVTLDLGNKIGDIQAKTSALNNLSMVETKLGNFDIAQNYLIQSINIAQETGNRFDEAVSQYNLGVNAITANRFEEAMQPLLKSLELNRSINDTHGEANSLKYLGDLAVKENRIDEALNFYQSALKINKQLGNKALAKELEDALA